MPFFAGVEDVLDGTMCAVYMPHKVAGNKLMFCGRIRIEDSDFRISKGGRASFNVDGLAQTMNGIKCISWRHTDVDSPTAFDEVKTLTPWRSVGAYIREMTNINNTHSLVFDDVSDDYRYISYYYQKGTILESLRNQMWSVNADFEFTSDGMFKLARNMRYTPTAERAALPTIANFKVKHYVGANQDSVLYSVQHDHSYQVGRAIIGNGWYNTTTRNVSFFSALTPPVQPARGTEQSVTDRQILKADLSRKLAEVESKQRTRNNFAAKQQLDTLSGIRLSGAFVGMLNPSASQLYTQDITINDGIRRLVYTTSDKWLLTELSIGWNKKTGQIEVVPTFQIESDDLGFAVSIKNPAPLVPYAAAVMMPLAAMPTYPHASSHDFPTGATEEDEQPVEGDDVQDVGVAQDPLSYPVVNDSTAVWINEDSVFMTTNISSPLPTWLDVTPPGIPEDHKIKHFAWNGAADGGFGGYVITNNDTIADPETCVFYRESVNSQAAWVKTILTDILATLGNVTDNSGVIIYGLSRHYVPVSGFPLEGLAFYSKTDDMDEDGTADLVASSHESLSQPASNYPGIYDDDTQKILGGAGSQGGVAATIKWAIPPGLTVTDIFVRGDYKRPIATPQGYKRWSIEGFDKQFGSLLVFNVGEFFNVGFGTSVNMPILPGTQQYLYFHLSMDRKESDGAYVRFSGIQVDGTVEADWVSTRYSDDKGASFEAAQGVGLMTLGEGSFTRRKGQRVLAAMDEKVKRAAFAGQGYLVTADQGSAIGAGRYAMAILKFGKGDDYLVAPDGGAVGLYKVVNDVLTNITPNDGFNDGFAIGPGSLAMTSVDDDYIWFLASFGGSYKLAYTTDLGNTWNFNTDPTSNSLWVAADPRRIDTVYVADASSILRSVDGGLNLTVYAAPSSDGQGVYPR